MGCTAIDWTNLRTSLLGGIPHRQVQEDLNDLDEHYDSYDAEDAVEVPSNQAQINCWFASRVDGINKKMSSVLAGIQSIQDILANPTALSISIIFCNIIAAVLTNIRLERRYFCGHPFVLLALLTLDDGAEVGLSN